MTQLAYFENPYLFRSDAEIIEIIESEIFTAVILDKTIFYPQGGGQPADIGTIVSKHSTFLVYDVRIDENGKVMHYGKFETNKFKSGEAVTLLVDEENRIQNTKLHSAGHLLDCAVAKLGLNLKPVKGFHFILGPYVEYKGSLANDSLILADIEKVANELIEKDLKLEIKELSIKEAEQQGLGIFTGKSARFINLEGYPGCGCGGTHVKSSGEIGKISIRKIKSKNGITKISYQVENCKL